MCVFVLRGAGGGVDGVNHRHSGWERMTYLFPQASYMHLILLAKIRAWASASGGCFPTAGLSYGQAQNSVTVAKYNRSMLFKWAKVNQVS